MKFQVPKFLRFWENKKAEHAASTFPPNWPSHLHSKCTIPTCYHPNPPQAVAGKYNCLGSFAGLPCFGTYQVTSSMAKAMVRSYSFKFTIHAGDGHSKSSRIVKPKHHEFGLPDETSKTNVDTSKLDKNKQLPPIPGLHLRKVQRAVPPYPRTEDSEPISTPWHAQTHRQQLYPQPVQQSSSGVVKSGSHPRDSAISLPRSLLAIHRYPADKPLGQFAQHAGSSTTVHTQRIYVHPKF